MYSDFGILMSSASVRDFDLLAIDPRCEGLASPGKIPLLAAVKSR
jgi:hypothetical protein